MTAPSRGPSIAGLVAVFFLSGISGLIYQVVWVRMLIRVFGITTFAISTVLAVFMTGLALGSFGAARLLARRDPLRAYASVELALGVTALASTLAMSGLPRVFEAVAASLGDSAAAVVAARFVLSALVLLPPTVLMGATLPLLSSATSAGGSIARSAGLLYGVNTLGAVLGVVASGFLLLLLLGERGSVLVGVALNVTAGAAAWVIGQRARALAGGPADAPPSAAAAPAPAVAETPASRRVLILVGLSGFAALAYEVVWSRLLTLVLGNSVYAFSAMLAVYLAGVGLGSLWMARRLDRVRHPLAALGVLEVVLAALALMSTRVVQALGETTTGGRYLYSQIWTFSDFGRIALHAVVIVLPTTLVLGAMFPLATRVHADEVRVAAVSTGRVYGFNTIGSIAGSVLTGFLLIPAVGTLPSFQLAALTSVVVGVWAFRADREAAQQSGLRLTMAVAALLFVIALATSMRDPTLAVLEARLPPGDHIVAHREHTSATVTAVESEGSRDLYVNGLYVASTGFTGRFMAHMPLLFHPKPERSLIICLGVGEAFRAAQDHGTQTTVVELVPDVVDLFALFHPDDHARYTDPPARVVVNDGRNHLLRATERWDFMLVDGTPPIFASGMVNLYSLEFVALVERHLTDLGIFALWIPVNLFESDLWMIARNFTDVFPHVQLWAHPAVSGIFVLGTRAQAPLFEASAQALADRIAARGLTRERDLDPQLIAGGFPFTEAELRARAARYAPVTDDRPVTEFPLLRFWRGLPFHESSAFLFEGHRRGP